MFGRAKDHGFVDGDKRVAFMAAYVFLGLNGSDLSATEVKDATVVDDVAASRVSEAKLAIWFRGRLGPSGRR